MIFLFQWWCDYSWPLLIFLPVNMLIHTLSSKRTSHHPQTPCCLSPPIFSHYMWEATSESAYYALKCFISVSVLVVPFPPHAYQVLIHSNFESCLIEKKRVMVISSIGMWPFAPAVIKTFSPLIFWFLVSSMNIVHLGEIFIGDVNCWNYKQQG